jgi:CheY-like chemotaxis protein
MTGQSVLRFAPAFASRIFRKSADPSAVLATVRNLGRPADRQEDVVVIADDDPATRELLAAYLMARSFRTVEAADGRATLEAISDGAPRRLLIDLMMPGIDGLSVLEHLWRTSPEILERTVIVTGMPEHAIELLPPLGVRGVVRKPIDFHELDALLSERPSEER